MKLPPGWESFWQPAVPHVRREWVAYRKTAADLVVQWSGRWQVMRGEGLMCGGFASAIEAIRWADQQPVEAAK